MALEKHAHDRFFKEAFSRPDVVADFIQAYLPPEFSEQLHVDTLTRLQESHVGETLSEHFVDMLYSAAFGGRPFTIALLLEHKSYVEPYPHFQLAQYMLNYWQSQLKQDQPLRPILPIVIFHGRGCWQHRPMRTYFKDTTDLLAESIPDFRYYLINLSDRKLADKMVLLRSNYAKLTAGLLATIRHKQRLVKMLELLKTALDELAEDPAGTQFIGTASVYILLRSGLTKIEIRAIFQRITPKNASTIMSAGEQLIEEGKHEATLKHIRGLLRLGMDEHMIANAFELPLKTVRQYIAQIQQESK